MSYKSIEADSSNPASQPLYELLLAESQLARASIPVLRARLAAFEGFSKMISLQLWDLFHLHEYGCQLIANTEGAIQRMERDENF